MRFYNKNHDFYCGIDLHSTKMYLCILDKDGEKVLHRNMKASPGAFLKAIAPFRENLVVSAECIFCWYWLADLCEDEGIPFILGHALYMKAIHGGKAKNDRIDAFKIATILRGGTFPEAYVYPRGMRSTRDLLRRRSHLVTMRGDFLAHAQMSHYQHALEKPTARLAYKANRIGVADAFEDDSARRSVEIDFVMAGYLDLEIRALELELKRKAKAHQPESFALLKTIPGVGDILAMTILYEIHTIDRFESVQKFASYSRLVKCAKESNGKRMGSSGSKIGNAHLKWAYSEAAVLFLRCNDRGKKYLAKLERKHGKGKSLSILAHKLGRASYHMLKRKKAFDMERFMAA